MLITQPASFKDQQIDHPSSGKQLIHPISGRSMGQLARTKYLIIAQAGIGQK
jgi:hypothetical protein